MENSNTANTKTRKYLVREEIDLESYAIAREKKLSHEDIDYQCTLPQWMIESLNRYYGCVPIPTDFKKQ